MVSGLPVTRQLTEFTIAHLRSSMPSKHRLISGEQIYIWIQVILSDHGYEFTIPLPMTTQAPKGPGVCDYLWKLACMEVGN